MNERVEMSSEGKKALKLFFPDVTDAKIEELAEYFGQFDITIKKLEELSKQDMQNAKELAAISIMEILRIFPNNEAGELLACLFESGDLFKKFRKEAVALFDLFERLKEEKKYARG